MNHKIRNSKFKVGLHTYGDFRLYVYKGKKLYHED